MDQPDLDRWVDEFAKAYVRSIEEVLRGCMLDQMDREKIKAVFGVDVSQIACEVRKIEENFALVKDEFESIEPEVEIDVDGMISFGEFEFPARAELPKIDEGMIVATEYVAPDLPCRGCARVVSPGDAKCWWCECSNPGSRP